MPNPIQFHRDLPIVCSTQLGPGLRCVRACQHASAVTAAPSRCPLRAQVRLPASLLGRRRKGRCRFSPIAPFVRGHHKLLAKPGLVKGWPSHLGPAWRWLNRCTGIGAQVQAYRSRQPACLAPQLRQAWHRATATACRPNYRHGRFLASKLGPRRSVPAGRTELNGDEVEHEPAQTAGPLSYPNGIASAPGLCLYNGSDHATRAKGGRSTASCGA
jgi:hypothetical protein